MVRIFDEMPDKDPNVVKDVMPKDLDEIFEDPESLPVTIMEYYTGKPILGGNEKQLTLVNMVLNLYRQ